MKNISLLRKNIIFAILILSASLVSCNGKKYNLPKETLVITKADGTNVEVKAELATKDEERQYGFMNRKVIPDGTGMLFVFTTDRQLDFWMKNTPHPLSIAYIDSFGVIRDILNMQPYSTRSVSSTRKVRFALEVPQGWFVANGIKTGDTVTRNDGSALKTISAR